VSRDFLSKEVLKRMSTCIRTGAGAAAAVIDESVFADYPSDPDEDPDDDSSSSEP
jgi:hypothetical protein